MSNPSDSNNATPRIYELNHPLYITHSIKPQPFPTTFPGGHSVFQGIDLSRIHFEGSQITVVKGGLYVDPSTVGRPAGTHDNRYGGNHDIGTHPNHAGYAWLFTYLSIPFLKTIPIGPRSHISYIPDNVFRQPSGHDRPHVS
jgi:hypothetical protein